MFINTLNQKILLFVVVSSTISLAEKPLLTPQKNALAVLTSTGLAKEKQPLRLHLGCGEQRFAGYVNIDFPQSEHTVQTTSVADAYANLNLLSFPTGTVDEIRSHHVFEHFDRSEAMALLCKWFDWLKIGGQLVIETPDFQTSYRLLEQSNLSYLQKQVVMRHIFGSHEAKWAIHCDGWYKDKFEHILNRLGFENVSCTFTVGGYGLTPNIIVHATKKRNINMSELKTRGKNLLRHHMTCTADSEEKMWQVWCEMFEAVC